MPVLYTIRCTPKTCPQLQNSSFPSPMRLADEEILGTVLGHSLRLASGGKIFPYMEDRDPSLWAKYVDKEKSGRMAHHGNTAPEEMEKNEDSTASSGSNSTAGRSGASPPQESDSPRLSSETRVESGEDTWNEASGVKVDPGKAYSSTLIFMVFVGTGSKDANKPQLDPKQSPVPICCGDVRGLDANVALLEKGRDVTIVTWFSDNDPEVSTPCCIFALESPFYA